MAETLTKDADLIREMRKRDMLEGEKRSKNRMVGLACIKAGVPVIMVNGDKEPIHKRWPELSSSIDQDEWDEAEEAHLERFNNSLKYPFHMGAIGDEVTFRRNMDRNKDCLIGIPMGVNKLVVLDPDHKAAGHGPTLLRDFFEQHGGIPENVIISPTQGGGEHWYFSDRENKFTNAEGALSAQLTNVRGSRGQALAPGCVMPGGNTYGDAKNLKRLLDAIAAGTLPQIPQFVVDHITRGRPTAVDSDIVHEKEIGVLAKALRASHIIGKDEIFDPALGGFDLEAVKADRPKFAELMARDEPLNEDYSTARLSFIANMKGAYPNATALQILSAMIAAPKVCGEYVTDRKPSKGHFNARNAAKDFLKAKSQGQAAPADPEAIGAMFGDVTGCTLTTPTASLMANADRMSDAPVDANVSAAPADNAMAESVTPDKADSAIDATAESPAIVYDPDATDDAASEQRVKPGWIDAAEIVRNRKPMSWLVKGLIPAQGVGVVYGKPNVGKSFFMIDLANNVRRGRTFCGRKTKPCAVLYLYGEGAFGIGGRLQAWHDNHDVSGGTISIGTHAPDLQGENAVKRIVANARSVEKATCEKLGMILIDTLSACAPQANDSDAADMKPIMAALRKISDTLGCAVLASHHPGKNQAAGMRGSTAIIGAADFVLPIIDERGVKTLSIEKMRDGRTDSNVSFRLKEVQIGLDEDNEPETSCIVVPVAVDQDAVGAGLIADEDPLLVPPDKLEDRCASILKAMRTLADDGLADDERGGGTNMSFSVGEIATELNRWRSSVGLQVLKRQRVSETAQSMVTSDKLIRVGSKHSAKYRMPKKGI